jgi:hypothetical protein
MLNEENPEQDFIDALEDAFDIVHIDIIIKKYGVTKFEAMMLYIMFEQSGEIMVINSRIRQINNYIIKL